MGILKDQSLRLLRESWAGPDPLAEEMWAILQSEDPVQIDSPVQVDSSGTGGAPLQLTFGNSPGITLNKGGLSVSIDITQGGLTFTDPYPTPAPGQIPTVPSGQKPGGGVLGKVVSGGATGDAGTTGTQDYRVDLYENGLDAKKTRTVTVTQVLIDQGETIPVGWPVYVVGDSNKGGFLMQVPVWM